MCRRVASQQPDKFMDAKKAIITVGRALWEEGLVTSHGGNISCRIAENRILITKTSTKLGFLSEKDLIEVPIPSTKEDFPQASSELIVHSTIYQLTDAQCVVHAHPPFTVTLSLMNMDIEALDTEGKLTYRRCPVIEVNNPHASWELAQSVAEALKNHQIVCVKGHGTFAKGKTLDEALFYSSAVEFSAKLLFNLKVK